MRPGLQKLFLILCLTVASVGHSESSDAVVALYNQGNESYRQGDFDRAILAYEKVIEQGFQNGDVHYNLGNAYFKTDQLGRAILAYERALKLMPGDEDVLANLRFANARRMDKEAASTPNFVTRVLRGVYDFFNINTLAVLCLVFVFGVGGALIGWLFAPARRIVWIAGLIVFGTGFFTSGVLLAFKAHDHGEVAAIILQTEVIGRSGPGTDFLQVFVLHEGTKVFVERAEGQWFLIKLSNGVGGWVNRDVLEQI